MSFTNSLKDDKKHLVRKFYANMTYVKKGTKVIKVQTLKVRFDQCTLNQYMEFEELEQVQYLEKISISDVVLPWLAEILAALGPPPPWIIAGVPIAQATLKFEVKGR